MTTKRTLIFLGTLLFCWAPARAQSGAEHYADRYALCRTKGPATWTDDDCKWIAKGQFWEGMSPDQKAAAEATAKDIDAEKMRGAAARRKKTASPAVAQIVQPAATKLATQDSAAPWGGLILFVLAVVLYFLPAIIAGSRGHHQSTAICVLDLFLGWTVLGWIIALVWASTAIHGESPKVPVNV
ncbi:MAG TPA: superinfection immunity protein [Candidatus Dormibacteraeota bacterium]|nr:superinfection immunity protein [Candidatus Dormibacteraeota bacterium]